MLKNFVMIFASYSLLMPSILFAMDRPQLRAQTTNEVIFLTSNRVIHAGKAGCFILDLSRRNIRKTLCDSPTYNLITNRDKSKVGLFCDNRFLVYDVNKEKRIWLHAIPYSENYSAVFSNLDDTIFLCHKGELISDRFPTISLPFSETTQGIGILCHPQKKEIAYFSYIKKMLSIDDYPSQTFTNVAIPYLTMTNRIGHICRILQSPYTPHAVLWNKNNTIFLFNTDTKNIREITEIPLEDCNSTCYDCKFLPDSPLLAILCNANSVHFWNFIEEKTIDVKYFDMKSFKNKRDNARKKIDFTPDAKAYIIYIGNKYCITKTEPDIMQIIEKTTRPVFAYWLLKNYSRTHNFILQDIINLIIKGLVILYEH